MYMDNKLNKKKLLYKIIKRWMDLFFSIIGLTIAIPVIIVFAILIKLDSKGPVIYAQQRLGKKRKVFFIYKLRSMYVVLDENSQQWTQINDPRVTKIGKLIRSFRIDELPQFFNIIKGDMSLVGPRPERPYFVKEFEQTLPDFEKRLKVKPGLTGWAQVNGGYDISIEEKLNKDLYYIENQSLLLDIKIILKTVIIVINRSGVR